VVTFSQKSEELRLVHQLVECLEILGVSRDCIFYQPDISLVDQENHWISQWLYAQRHSKVVVCMLSCTYLRSKPCCTEWKLIPEWQRLVVGVDPAVELLKTEITGFNGPPLAYVQCGEQMLDARTSTPAHIAAKIVEKYEVNKEKSHAFQLKRGSAEDELVIGVEVEGADSMPPEISVPLSVPERTERQFSVSKLLKTPPLKFLIPSPHNTESKGSGDDDSAKGGKPLPKASPCRLAVSTPNELDGYRLTPSRATKEKDKSWFG
jgi:hypothetical protein